MRIPLIILSALLMSLAFHPLGLHFLAWFGLVPLILAIDGAKPSLAFKTGIVFGFFFSLLSLFWIVFLQIETKIKILMLFGMVLMFLYLGLYFGVGFLISNKISIWSLPFAICGLEFLKGLGELGFPWLTLGYTQARYPLIAQQASIYGVYGISFWLVLVNVAFYKLIKHRGTKEIIVASLIFVLPIVYGAMRMDQQREDMITIGVVQPNIDPNLKFTKALREETFTRLTRLSQKCVETAQNEIGNRPALIVWPETAIPFFIRTPSSYQDLVTALADTIDVPIFTGTPIYDRDKREIYNGAVLVEPRIGIVQEYRKLHLVPFGEHIPFDRYVPLFRKIDFGEGDYSPGDKYTVFRYENLKFSCLICFESIFTDLSRAFVRNGAQLLLNITNDGWFGKISGPQQHNDMAILRTIENGVPLARSANTGISMIVDQYGRVNKETNLFEEDYIVARISTKKIRTLYQDIGDLLPILSLTLATIMLTLAQCGVLRKK